MTSNLNQLRKDMRARRQQLSQSMQTQNAKQALDFAKQLLNNSEFSKPQKIALFFTQDGELSTTPLIQYLWQETQHEVYLPVLHTLEKEPMTFAHYTESSRLQKNRFNIPEPFNTKSITAAELDWVFVPLVAYDQTGNRMGMGGGFYDRTFAFKQQSRPSNKPYLIGWAHSLQKVASLPTQPWDIPLYALINEKQIDWFENSLLS